MKNKMKKMIKFEGTKKEVEKKAFELFKEGYIVFKEPYDRKIWCGVARLP